MLGLGFPYDWPSVARQANFIDFSDWAARFRFYHHLSFFQQGAPLMYPAPVALAYKIFSLGNHSVEVWGITRRFLIIMLVSVLFMLAGLGAALVRRGVAPVVALAFLAASLALSFPFWFEFTRANMEFVVWLLIMLGLYLFCLGHRWSPAALFGIAASMKIFPFVFLGLLIGRKQYRQAAFGLVAAAIVTIASLWLLYPDVVASWHYTNGGVKLFRSTYMLHLRPQEIGFDHSLFALIKRAIPVLPPPATMTHLLSAYLGVVALAGIALFFTRIRHLPLLNQVTCLVVCSILLPPTSYDYTLLHLYAPWAMMMLLWVEAAQTGEQLRHRAAWNFSLACYALLFTPQSEFIYHGVPLGGQIKAVTLVALLYTALRYPLEVDRSESASTLPARPSEASTLTLLTSGTS